MNTIEEYTKLALADIKAAELLYLNNFYPHSLYLAGQALEKLTKAQLIRYGCVDPKSNEMKTKISHNLFQASAEYWKQQKTMWKATKIAQARMKNKDWYKEAEKRSKDFDPFDKIDIDKIIDSIENHIMKLEKEAKNKQRKLAEPDKTVERLDIKLKQILESINEKKNEMKKYRNEFSSKIEETKDKKRKDDLVKSFEITRELEGFIIGQMITDYINYTTEELIFLMPNQDELRYPEKKPFETYNEQHPLIKNFSKIKDHIKTACEYMLKLDFSYWDDPKIEK